VKVVIDGAQEVVLTPATGDPLNYAAGVVYESAPMTLSAGQKTFHFAANDGLDPARFPTGTADITGLTIRNILVLEAPTGGTVSPSNGPVSTQFTYQVVYKNADNTPPAYVRVVIDDGTAGRVERTMTKATAGNNYVAGVTYQYVHRFALTETSPTHTYRFEAQDTLSPVVIKLPATDNFTGPTLNIAKFENVTFNPNPGSIGSPITVTGKLNVGGPITTTIVVQLVSPDGAGTNNSVTTNADGTFTFNNFTPQQTGDWKVRLSWGGTVGTFDTITEEFPIRVTGVTLPLPSGQLDLVASPLIPVTPDPAITFGPTLPGTQTSVPVTTLNVVKWVPSGNQGQYLLLNSDGNFPGIAAGNSYWMRPSQAVDLNPRGRLVDQTQPYAIPLPVGWNMFGSVYLQDINWSAVQVRFNGVVRNISDAGDAVRPIAWGYNKATGGYEAVSSSGVLRSGRGYWVRVLQPGVELILNPPGTRSASRAADIRDGSIQLAATAGSRMDADTYIPLTGSYKSRIADLEKPPYLDSYVSVRLLPSESVTLPETTRAANPNANVVAFEVVTDQKNTDVTLQLRNGAELGRKYNLRLVDITAKQTRAMQSTSGVTFNTGANTTPRRFALLVDRVTITDRLRIDSLRVTGRSAGSYQFGYTVNQDVSVRVQIVGQDGRAVRDNVGGRAATRGANSMVWDLKDARGISVPAGSYTLKLTATKSDGEQVNHTLPVVVVR
jgi:hypothetical protein